MADERELAARVTQLEAHCAGLASLVVDLLEITHRGDLQRLRTMLATTSKTYELTQADGSAPELALEATRHRLGLLQQAVVGLEDG